MHFILILLSFLYPPETGKIEFNLSGINNSDGQIIVYLYKSPGNFPKSKNAFRVKKITKIKDLSIKASFDNIPHGVYAISVLHDANMSNKMDIGMFGPKEGYAFSYDPNGFGLPDFDECKFRLNRSVKKIDLKMSY